MRTVIWLLIAFGLLKNSLALTCYACKDTECPVDVVRFEECGVSTDTTTPQSGSSDTSDTPLSSDSSSSSESSLSTTESSSSTDSTLSTTGSISSTVESSPSTGGSPGIIQDRKRRSLQYYRESTEWKCFTQRDDSKLKGGKIDAHNAKFLSTENIITEKGCKAKDIECSGKCLECATDRCNGSNGFGFSVFTLGLVLVISKFV